MRRIALPSLALVAVFATAAAVSASAFAVEPVNLPESALTRTWTGEAEGEPEFVSETPEVGVLLKVLCKSATAEGTEEPKKPLGLFHIHFLGCRATVAGVEQKCTDLNHTTAGDILALGTWHLVFDKKIGGTFTELTTAVLFLVEQFHFSCGPLFLAQVKGEVVCLHLKATEKAFTHSFHCVRSGDEPTEEWCKKGDVGGKCEEPTAPKLESNVNETLFRKAALQMLGKTTYKVELFADV
jgi:hypothetical protein